MGVHGLLLPEHVAADLEREAMADEANVHIGNAVYIDSLIKAQYPNCELVWVKEGATAPDLVPARWHVRRRARDQGHMDSYFPWVGPNGEYREPDSSIVEALRRQDWQRRDIAGELRQEREAKATALQKQQAATAAANVDHMATSIKSRLAPGISFSDARPWTNRLKSLPGK